MARKYLAIQIYVQPDELQVARERAAAAGLSISEWGKRKMLGEPTMSEDTPRYQAGQERQATSDEIIAFALQRCGGDARCAETELAEALAKLLKERR